MWIRPTTNLGNNGSILTSSFACILWNSTTRSTYTLFIALPPILPTVSLSFLAIPISKNTLKIHSLRGNLEELIITKTFLLVLVWRVPFYGMKVLFQVLTCGHKLSIWVAAIRTNFTPSSLLEMEQARLATWNEQTKKGHGELNAFYIKIVSTENVFPFPQWQKRFNFHMAGCTLERFLLSRPALKNSSHPAQRMHSKLYLKLKKGKCFFKV